MTGLYVPGRSPFHAMPAALKLLLLFGLGIVLIALDQATLIAGMAAVVSACFVGVANLSVRRLWQTTRPLLIWFLIIFLAQAWLGSAGSAVSIVLRILTLVWAAALVTHTTRMTDMTQVFSVCLGVLRPLGVSTERLAFLCALTIRLVPALMEAFQHVREAQRARRVEGAYLATFVAVLIRVLKQADTMSDALISRGFDRWDEAR